MERNPSDAHTHVEATTSSMAPAPLKIRWGRTTMAGIGAIALLVAVISLPVVALTGASVALPLLSALVFVAVIAGLRMLAVRDAGRKAAFAASIAAQNAAQVENHVEEVTPPRETKLFDRAETEAPAPAPKVLTAEELRLAAMRVAAKGAADAKLAHTQTLAEGEFDGEKWEPIEVPVPGYVSAARAAAAEVEPLAVPVAPKSAGTSIKADQAGIRTPDLAVDVEIDVVETHITLKKAHSEIAAAEKPAHGLANLDDVLQRRRA